MPQYNLTKISQVVGGKLVGKGDTIIKNIITDSRNLFSPIGSLFFAIKGERHDGHKFIEDLHLKKGLNNFIVDYIPEPLMGTCCNFIVVDDSLEAMQQLAAFNRAQFKGDVIGITGSNGKTIVKEWLYQLLHNDKSIVRSPKSYNSQIGVPLSVWNIDKNADLAIIEAGISKTGEMEKLEKIVSPEIGIITNIGEAHQENFSSINEKIKEKLKLFKNSNVIIYNSGDELLEKEIKKAYKKDKKLYSWAINKDADLTITEIKHKADSTNIKGNFKERNIEIIIPFTDKASIENAITCWTVLLYLNITDKIIKERMQHLSPVAMRLELINGINNCTIINDSYNSDIHSLDIALDFLNQQHQHPLKTVILSDILETGKQENILYSTVSDMLLSKKINRIIGIGPALFKNAGLFNINKNFYLTTEDFLKQLHPDDFDNEAILLKGARNFEFEQISAILEQKAHLTTLEINLSAMIHNLNYFKSKLKQNTKIVIMVKAFSYGSGSYEIANMLEHQKVDYLAVAFADEGVALRKAGIAMPIMVMNPEEAAYRTIIEYNLEPEIFSFAELKSFSNLLKISQIENFPVHLKIDSGMHRLGFVESEIPALCNELVNNKSVEVKSIFSHFAASDDVQQDNFTKEQISKFSEMSSKVIKALGKPIDRHISNSMGIERFGEAKFEMVRLGIGLYGVNDFNQSQLRNVSSLKTTILQIKDIKAGETVGYGRRGKVEKDKKIAIIPIGYADGYSRRLGVGNGRVWVNGHFAPVIGSICMDMTMIDITGISAKEGDEIEVFGDHVTIQELATKMDTIPYEVLTGISPRVKRVYIQE
jgi:alanine racemase